jgi:hypothetical protein
MQKGGLRAVNRDRVFSAEQFPQYMSDSLAPGRRNQGQRLWPIYYAASTSITRRANLTWFADSLQVSSGLFPPASGSATAGWVRGRFCSLMPVPCCLLLHSSGLGILGIVLRYLDLFWQGPCRAEPDAHGGCYATPAAMVTPESSVRVLEKMAGARLV